MHGETLKLIQRYVFNIFLASADDFLYPLFIKIGVIVKH